MVSLLATILSLLFVPHEAAFAGPAVDVSAASVPSGGAVTATISNSSGSPSDWVGVYAAGSKDYASYLDWRYLNGKQVLSNAGAKSASFPIPMPAASGQYQIVLYQKGGTLLASSQPVTVDPGASIYVPSSLTKDLTCTQIFSGKRPANLAASHYPSFGEATVQYKWDYAASAVWDETSRYGYHPTFNPDRGSFAANGRPMIRDKYFHLQVLNDKGTWQTIDLLALAKQSMALQGVTNWPISAVGAYSVFSAEYADPGYSSEVRVVFDSSCNAYALINANRTLGYSILMHSPDGGHSWGAYPVPGSNGGNMAVSMELPTRSHLLQDTPVLLIRQWYQYAGSPNSIKIVVPRKQSNGALDLGREQLIVQNTVSQPSVGGAENSAISSGDNVYLVFPGANPALDPISGRHGAPQYIVTYSRSAQRVIAGPVFLGVTVGQADEAVVDPHNQPTVAIDSKHFLHVVLGGHDGPLYCRMAARPDDSTAWGPIEILGQKAGVPGSITDQYTYPSLVIGSYDSPVIVARYNNDGYTFKLAYLSKNASTGQWADQQIVLDPGRVFYGHWYNKLSIDPWGRLFLNYHYYPDNLFSDEAKIFASTYHFKLSPIGGCVASTHVASPLNYCAFSTYEAVNSTVLVSPGLGRPFQLADTPDFFFGP